MKNFCLELGSRGRWREVGGVVRVVEKEWGKRAGGWEGGRSVWGVCLKRELFLMAFRQTSRRGGREIGKKGWVEEDSFRFIVDFLPKYLDGEFPFLDQGEREREKEEKERVRERKRQEKEEKERKAEKNRERWEDSDESSEEEDWEEEEDEEDEDEEDDEESWGEGEERWNGRREREIFLLLTECQCELLLVSVVVGGLVRPFSSSSPSVLSKMVDYLYERRKEKKEQNDEEDCGWGGGEEEKDGGKESVSYLGGVVKEFMKTTSKRRTWGWGWRRETQRNDSLPFFVFCCVERYDFFVFWMGMYGNFEKEQLIEVTFIIMIFIHFA